MNAQVQLNKVTVELANLYITRRNEGTGICSLHVGGVQVGMAQAHYVTKTQRYWEARFLADVNGQPFDLHITQVFSAINITKAFVNHIKATLTNGVDGVLLQDNKDIKVHLKRDPKPEQAPQGGEQGQAQGGEQDPAAGSAGGDVIDGEFAVVTDKALPAPDAQPDSVAQNEQQEQAPAEQEGAKGKRKGSKK